MKYRIKDKKYINKPEAITEYEVYGKFSIANGLLKGQLSYAFCEVEDYEFNCLDEFRHRGKPYMVVENAELGVYIVPTRNLEEIEEFEDKLNSLGITEIIVNGPATIMFDDSGEKYVTKVDSRDNYDIEKAIMILLLKKEGYNLDTIFEVAEELTERGK